MRVAGDLSSLLLTTIPSYLLSGSIGNTAIKASLHGLYSGSRQRQGFWQAARLCTLSRRDRRL